MVANNSLLGLNETVYNLNMLTGEPLISGLLVLAAVMILLEIIDLPIYGKVGIWVLLSFAVMNVFGIPQVISAIILVIGGILYFFIFRRAVE